MALDPVKNFAISRVATAPSPADSGTTLVVETGDGALFPDPSSSGAYNVVIYPNGEQPTSTNAEIVRVTARTSDTMTITREQESSSARTIVEGDIVMLGITAKVIGDIQDVVEEAETSATNAQTLITEFNGGWVDAQETWTYASADDPTYTFTVAADVTTKYSVGMKIKLTQGTVKYFIITAISAFTGGNTTITVYGGTDYDLASSAISANYYSMVRSPQGFPMSPTKWTQQNLMTSSVTQATPTTGTVYNMGGSLSIPIGLWNVMYEAPARGDFSGAFAQVLTTLSTANNSESDKNWTTYSVSASSAIGANVARSGIIERASKATYYLNIWQSTGATGTNLYVFGDLSTAIIRATCAYL